MLFSFYFTLKSGDFELDKNNKFLIDWFAFSSPIYSPEYIIEFLGLSDCKFLKIYGFHGYKDRLYFDGIGISFNHPLNEGIFVEMSGQGCRAFETFSKISFETLIRNICIDLYNDKHSFNITRIDLAFDDFTGLIPGDKLFLDMMSENFVTKFNSIKSKATVHPGYKGFTFEFGSAQSNVRFRIYDKAFERGFVKDSDYFHWYRWEIQFNRSAALELLKYLDCDYENIGGIFTGIINNYLRFVTPSKTDSNKRRWKTRPWFNKFLNTTEKLSVFTKCNQEYNLGKLKNYVYNQSGNAIKTLLAVEGLEGFAKGLQENSSKLPDKYKCIMNDNNTPEENILAVLEFLENDTKRN